jgi:DNA-binding transcriptional ArsR family regulator
MSLCEHRHFVYHQIMNVEEKTDLVISRLAAAIGEPARVRILYCLLDGHARTSTELSVVADVSPSTASAHLMRLKTERLIKMVVQGKHRYYSLGGPDVANALEGLSVIAGGSHKEFLPNTPGRLREARTCYDHMAGRVAVLLHNRFKTMRWLSANSSVRDNGYDLTPSGAKALAALGIDLDAIRTLRRRFAYACLDWSERQPHIGGALGAALLKTALKRKWVVEDLDSRILSVTSRGRGEMLARFGVQV